MQTPPPEAADSTWLLSTIVIIGGALALFANYVIWKGRPPKGDNVFRASRLTKGNRIFPVYFVVSQTSVTIDAAAMDRQERGIGPHRARFID